jgi:hypothetical protein
VIAGYSVTGGSPPPALESLQVFEDGRARAVVTSAFPHGARQDEAGVYECSLDADALARVRAMTEDPALLALAGEHGAVRADSGRVSLRLGDATIVWGAFSEPPEVASAVAVMRAMLEDVRRHPVAAVRMAVAEGELELSNPGEQPVGVSLLRPRVASGSPSLSLYRAAEEVAAPADVVLAGGERVALGVEVEPSAVAFATATFELPDVRLDGFLVART